MQLLKKSRILPYSWRCTSALTKLSAHISRIAIKIENQTSQNVQQSIEKAIIDNKIMTAQFLGNGKYNNYLLIIN